MLGDYDSWSGALYPLTHGVSHAACLETEAWNFAVSHPFLPKYLSWAYSLLL